jgi:hypothetical protein
MPTAQPPSIELTCPDCLAEMVVVPPTLAHFKQDPPVVVRPPDVQPGQTLVYTDEEGNFECPNPDCPFASDWDALVEADSAT